MGEVATQDRKLKLYFRDESITVIHDVEHFKFDIKTYGQPYIHYIRWIKLNLRFK